MTVQKCDGLRNPIDAYISDERSPMFGVNSIQDQYDGIVEYVLADYVPEDVVTQYEVARNLYLYAYNVYRFYMVAEHQALVTLEFAIKECIGSDEIKLYGKEIKKGQGLAACLHYVFDKGLVENVDFPIWRHHRKADAEEKFQRKKIKEMIDKDLDSIEVDYAEIDYEEHTLEYDYLSVLSKIMPNIRNNHAHGSNTLHNNVRTTFENVSTIINKIYKP